MKNQQLFVPRGKVLGGSSSINELMYTRGNSENYKHWSPGWTYDENLPFFLKSENSQIDGQKHYEGKGGLWNVEYSSAYSPILPFFVEGNRELGKNYVDYNGKDQVGVGRVQYNTKIGVRQSTGTAFLDNARKRKNLTVLTKALVVKVLIEKENNTATGVQFIYKNKKYNARAINEVLLSAGAFNTPQLLMLSGIGPRTSLEEKGIPVIKDLPVGQNLIEHMAFPGLIFRTNFTFPDNNVDTEVDMYLNASRLLCDPFKLEGVGFLLTNYSEKEPSIEYLYGPASILSRARSRLSNFNYIVSNEIERTINKNKDIILYMTLLQPKSRGEVTLKSNDPIDFPNIDFKMFTHSEDIDNMLAGIHFILKLSNTAAFQRINTSLVDIPLLCFWKVKYSDQYWECLVRSLSSTLHHASGTTAMGSNSSNSVVDNYLMVHGIQNLRIIDAGVIPSPISGHTNAPVVMIAEKGSCLIKKHYIKFLCK